MRVAIERRPKASSRQILGLRQLVAACNSGGRGGCSGGSSGGRGGDSGGGEGGERGGRAGSSEGGYGPVYDGVECTVHTFGQSLLADMLLMNGTDVLVAHHGAGEMNAIFMPPHASLLELRGRREGDPWTFSLADRWHPDIARKSNSWGQGAKARTSYLFWALVLADPQLVEPSAIEVAGFYPHVHKPT